MPPCHSSVQRGGAPRCAAPAPAPTGHKARGKGAPACWLPMLHAPLRQGVTRQAPLHHPPPPPRRCPCPALLAPPAPAGGAPAPPPLPPAPAPGTPCSTATRRPAHGRPPRALPTPQKIGARGSRLCQGCRQKEHQEQRGKGKCSPTSRRRCRRRRRRRLGQRLATPLHPALEQGSPTLRRRRLGQRLAAPLHPALALARAGKPRASRAGWQHCQSPWLPQEAEGQSLAAPCMP